MDAVVACAESGCPVFHVASRFFQTPAESTVELVLPVARDGVVSPLAAFRKFIQRFERTAGLAEQPGSVSNGGRANSDLDGFCSSCGDTGNKFVRDDAIGFENT